MFKRTPKPLNVEQVRVYRAMIAIAHRKNGQIYTVSDLLKGINHNLNANEQRRIGRRFSYYVRKSKHLEIYSTKGNLTYFTKF